MEETIVRVLDCVPPTPGWKWLPDCNMVVVSSQLTREEQDAAIADLQAKWRRSMLRVVPSTGPTSETMKHGDQAEEAAVR